MPISLEALRKRTSKVSHTFEDGSSITLEFRVGELTEDKVQAALNGPSNHVGVDALPGIITAWDLEDENGETLPITTETFKQLDYPLLSFLFQLVRQAEDPFLKSGKR